MNKRSGEESKQKILDAAMAVFSEVGYAGASMRSIASAAGISVGGLYLYFRSKEELYLTLMQRWMDDLDAVTRETVEPAQDAGEALTSFIFTSVAFATAHQELILLQGRELGFGLGIEVKRRFFQQRRRLLADIIRRGVASGVFRSCDPEEGAKVIFSALRGFILSIVIEEEALFSPKECADLILHGLLSPKPSTRR